MESWIGAMEWSFGVDFGVEWSQILSFCHPSRTGFYNLTDRQRLRVWREPEAKTQTKPDHI